MVHAFGVRQILANLVTNAIPFEEFFRIPNAGATNGNGLGLAISRRIARLLGGEVTVADADGGGAVFTMWFPSSAGARERVHEIAPETSLLMT